MTIYAPYYFDDNACQWYRVEQPLIAMRESRLADVILDRLEHRGDRVRPDLQRMASVVWCHRRFDHGFEEWAKFERSHGSKKLFLMDLDDDEFRVLPSNENVWNDRGIVNQFGDKLSPEDCDKLSLKNELERRYNKLSVLKSNIAAADIVTCTTPRLQRSIIREVPSAKTFILPNGIDSREFVQINHSVDSRVRLLWQGGMSHRDCIQSSIATYRRIHDEFPETDFIVYGDMFEEWRILKRVQHVKFTKFSRFYARLNSFAHDIALLPLKRNEFNECRSAIKFYESACCSKPAACVASNVGSFSDELQHRVTGMLYDSEEEHYYALRELIKNKSMRLSIAEAGKQWCLKHRDPLIIARSIIEHIDVK